MYLMYHLFSQQHYLASLTTRANGVSEGNMAGIVQCQKNDVPLFSYFVRFFWDKRVTSLYSIGGRNKSERAEATCLHYS